MSALKLLLTAAAFVSFASAAPIVNSTGLASPVSVITFDEIILPDFTSLTNQYQALGVTFANVTYNGQGANGTSYPGLTNPNYAANFSPITNPFSIFFTNPVTEAAFGFATNPGTSTIEALLGGVLVESFVQATTLDDPNTAFLGFTGITFDEIRITAGGSNNAAVFDNIQIGPAGVPEPGTFGLAGLGLGAALWFTRRRRQCRA